MKCDRCGKPSVYHSTLIVNGVSQNTHLCRECAIKEGVFSKAPNSLFDDMFSTFADFLPFESVEDINCPVCKTTLKQFKSSGILGCPNCYQAFQDEISKIIKRIAPYSQHKQISDTKATKKTKTDKITELRLEMAQAVKEERYEDAAKIRDEIKKINED